MKKIFSLFVLSFCFIVVPISSSEIDANAVKTMLEQFKNNKLLSQKDYDNALEKLGKISKEQWSEINANARSAVSQAESNPSTNNNIDEAAKKIDVDSGEFKAIQKMVQDALSSKK